MTHVYYEDAEGNIQEIETTLNHLFWSEGEWQAAGTLKAGDSLTLWNGTQVSVREITYENRHTTVYNMEVADYHTYYVGEQSVWVHNTNGTCGGLVRQSGAGTESDTRIVNGFDTTVNAGKQGKHIVGNNNFIEGRSVFNGTVDDAQRLVDNFAGTGEWIGTNKERVNFGEVIGKYVNPATNEAIDTTVGIIHYSKSGTHIVPAQPIQ